MQILTDYLELVRKDHFNFDVTFIFILGIFLSLTVFFTKLDIITFWSHIGNTITVIIAAFSVLAGFNITSLSIFATSNSDIAQKLREDKIEGTERKQMEQILAYFAWSVIVQLTVLFFLIIATAFNSFSNLIKCYLTNPFINNLFWIITILGMLGMLYSIILTIRNIAILYHYLIAEAR